MIKEAKFDSDNLIYNRFDLIHSNYIIIRCIENDAMYNIPVFCEEGIAHIGVWGKQLPDRVFSQLVTQLFRRKEIYGIDVIRGKNRYENYLVETIDFRVPIPESFDSLMNKMERRNRATIRRKYRWLNERVGNVTLEMWSKSNIPDSVVMTFFQWKKATHGKDYNCSPEQYLSNYHVTDAMLLKAGSMSVAVAFFCQVADIVYFENFSYNLDLQEYSPGLMIYVNLLEELIKRKCRYLYLGGGNYVYKTRFGAEQSISYSGTIYRKEFVDMIDAFFKEKNIGNVAFYGYGKCGHAFVQLSKSLSIHIDYGIDKNGTSRDDVSVLKPFGQLPVTDAIIITLMKEDDDVEIMLKNKGFEIYYWTHILSEVSKQYFRSNSETTNYK